MKISADEKIQNLVVELPGAIPVLEHHRIPFDSETGSPIEGACRRAGAPLNDVLKDLGGLLRRDDGRREDWDHAPLPALVHYILDHHHKFETHLIEHIRDLFKRVLAKYGDARPDLASLRTLFERLASNFTDHMRREESELFVHFRQEVAPGAGEFGRRELAHRSLPLVQELVDDHRRYGVEWAGIRALAGGFTTAPDADLLPRALNAALLQLEQYQKEHVQKEDGVLFKRIRTLAS